MTLSSEFAKRDSDELGKVLAKTPHDMEAGLAAHERDMFARTKPLATESARNLKLVFDEDAPQSVIDPFTNYKRIE